MTESDEILKAIPKENHERREAICKEIEDFYNHIVEEVGLPNDDISILYISYAFFHKSMILKLDPRIELDEEKSKQFDEHIVRMDKMLIDLLKGLGYRK
ncbi:MAG: hypothetical protein R3321_05770 [Nitrososphaeraceae archaeon]|nr:hypothetical protein [Nitrososphaeraceae archaeon]